MQMDINRYRSFVDRFDMPEDQKVAVLAHVWSIMGSFVDRAFGDAPEQQLAIARDIRPLWSPAIEAPKTCENAYRELAHQPKTALDFVDPLTPIFTDAATSPPARKRRR